MTHRGFDSRQRARSGSALTLHRSVIHFRPFESRFVKKAVWNNHTAGDSSGIRTPDTLIKSQVLYRLS